MRRRKFIALLGGAVSWPVVGRAQQPERMKRIGVLMGVASDAEGQARLASFLRGLQELGWTDGRNAKIEVRWAAGRADAARSYAAELGRVLINLIKPKQAVRSAPGSGHGQFARACSIAEMD